MKHVTLGDLTVGRIGLGMMGMSFAYAGAGSDDTESIRTLHRAVDLGVTLIDTAEVYGPYTNEELLGQALKRGYRDRVTVATKFGMISHTGRDGLDSSPASVRKAVEGSLRRLGVDHIDLYYQHRVDTSTSPIRSRPSPPTPAPPRRRSRSPGCCPAATTSSPSPAPSASPAWRRTPPPTPSPSPPSRPPASTPSPTPRVTTTTKPR